MDGISIFLSKNVSSLILLVLTKAVKLDLFALVVVVLVIFVSDFDNDDVAVVFTKIRHKAQMYNDILYPALLSMNKLDIITLPFRRLQCIIWFNNEVGRLIFYEIDRAHFRNHYYKKLSA